MRIALLSVVVVAMVGVSLTGCQTVAYRGASPSARTLTESPHEFKDFYLGMNFAFSLDRPIDYRRPDGPVLAMSVPQEATSALAPAPTAEASVANEPSDGD